VVQSARLERLTLRLDDDMSEHAVGIDLVEIARVRRALERHGDRFLERIYTPLEVAYCRGRISELAARFAAKEAVMKALGTGVRGISWRDIEVLPNPRGKPLVILHRTAAARAEQIGLHQIDISLSHSRAYAVAAVVGETLSMDAMERAPRTTFRPAPQHDARVREGRPGIESR
jgi:holo-[acyl-carrier protein] synthase